MKNNGQPPDRPKKNVPPPGPPGTVRSPFHPQFLDWLASSTTPETVGEVRYRGPWKVVETGDGFHAVLRAVEDLTAGDVPRHVLLARQDALLLAAALPSLSRPPIFSQQPEMEGAGEPVAYRLQREGRAVGRSLEPVEDLLPALHALRTLCAEPDALACLLEAAGREAVATAGRILAARMEEP